MNRISLIQYWGVDVVSVVNAGGEIGNNLNMHQYGRAIVRNLLVLRCLCLRCLWNAWRGVRCGRRAGGHFTFFKYQSSSEPPVVNV